MRGNIYMKKNYEMEPNKIETALYEYYKDMEFTDQLKHLICQRIDEIKLLTLEKNSNDGIHGVDYGKDMVQTSGGNSSTENCAIKNMTDIEQRISKLYADVRAINSQIAEVMDKNRNVESVIGLYEARANVEGEKKKYIELHYKEQKSLSKIADELNWSRRHMIRKHKEVLEELSRFMFLEVGNIA